MNKWIYDRKFLQKQSTAFSRYLFLQKSLTQISDRVSNTPLVLVILIWFNWKAQWKYVLVIARGQVQYSKYVQVSHICKIWKTSKIFANIAQGDNSFIVNTHSIFYLPEKKIMCKILTCFKASGISKHATCWQ